MRTSLKEINKDINLIAAACAVLSIVVVGLALTISNNSAKLDEALILLNRAESKPLQVTEPKSLSIHQDLTEQK